MEDVVRAPSMRQRQAQRDRARRLFEEIVMIISGISSIGEHFKGVVFVAMEGDVPRETVRTWAGYLEHDVESTEDQASLLEDVEATAKAVHHILHSTAKGLEVTDEDLDVITATLNRNNGTIRLRMVPEFDVWYYQRQGETAEFHLAKVTLEYLNAGVTCHKVCQHEGCGNIMTSGRGAKKFCSAECRKEHWSYKNQKRYYMEKQKESLANRARNSRNRKPNETSKNGGDDEER